MADYDVVVIGAGHNGLTAGAYMAKAGLKVMIVEKNSFVGGMCSTQELFPGFKVNLGAHFFYLYSKKLRDELELETKYGLELLPWEPLSFYPYKNGKYFLWYNDLERTVKEMQGHFSAKDAEGYRMFLEFWRAFGAGLGPAILNPPVSLGQILASMPSPEAEEAARKAFLFSVKRMMDELPIESEEIKAAIAAWAPITGFYGGPSAIGSNFKVGVNLLSPDPFHAVKGGMGQVSESIARSFKGKGGEIKLNSPVKKVLLDKGKTAGVELQTGGRITAKMVLSNVDCHNLFVKLVGEENVSPEFARAVKNMDFRGDYIQMFLALDELPDYTVLPGKSRGPQHNLVQIVPSLEHLERAWDDCKYGKPAERPGIFMTIPTAVDPSLAPPGKHYASAYVYYIPYDLIKGEGNKAKEAFADKAVDMITEHAPNFKKAVIDRKVFSGYDYETYFGITKGNPDHGNMDIANMFSWRPMPGWSQYRTPIEGLYLCDGSSHPGGGVTGASGYNCAHVVLADVEKGKPKSKTSSSKKTR